jgi:hypothetical protein
MDKYNIHIQYTCIDIIIYNLSYLYKIHMKIYVNIYVKIVMFLNTLMIFYNTKSIYTLHICKLYIKRLVTLIKYVV